MSNATSTPATKTCRRESRFVAAGAGLEPAHASRRDACFRQGAIPFRSSCPSNRLAETIRLERMAPYNGRAALAVRCLNPTQPRLPKNSLVGMERVELSCTRRWFLRPVCLPVPPHPHLLTHLRMNTLQVTGLLTQARALQQLDSPGRKFRPSVAKKQKPLDLSRGFGESSN
jgi:hypothetical protein